MVFHDREDLDLRGSIEPFKVTIEEFHTQKAEHLDDAFIKGTTVAISGSDIHMYRERTATLGGL
jgi:threonine dehydrogenase-like Zn-dependent dehydrogenase